MPEQVAIIACLLGAVLSYLIGLRAMQTSRRLANFRLRQEQIGRARRSFGITALLAILTVSLVVMGRNAEQNAPVPPPPPTSTKTQKPAATLQPKTSAPVPSSPTYFALTPTPASTSTTTATSMPSLPISIEAIFKSSVTPAGDLRIGAVRFSTELRKSQPVGPSTTFRNPIRRMYGVFSYEGMM